MNKALLQLWHRLHDHIYAPLAEAWWDFDHRNNPAPWSDACLVCGKQGHREQCCPNA